MADDFWRFRAEAPGRVRWRFDVPATAADADLVQVLVALLSARERGIFAQDPTLQPSILDRLPRAWQAPGMLHAGQRPLVRANLMQCRPWSEVVPLGRPDERPDRFR